MTSWVRPSILAVAVLLPTLVAVGSGEAHRLDGPAAFHLVSFDDRITDSSRRALARTGVEILGYEPPHGYIVWATSAQVDRASRLPEISFVSELPERRKVAPPLLLRDGSSLIDVTTHTDRLEVAREYLSSSGEVLSLQPLDAAGELMTITARVQPRSIADLARRPWIMYLSPASKGFSYDDEMGTLTVADRLEDGRPVGDYNKWLEQHDLSGDGVTVAVVDTGIADIHPDLTGHVVKTFNYGSTDESNHDYYSHGTHVAGIIGGSPSGSGPIFEDPNGFAYGQGMAPGALLVNQNTFALTSNYIPNSDNLSGFDLLARDAWNSGARIFNGSWSTGEGHRSGYVPSVRRVDELTRNALRNTREGEELLFVFSAGNDGELGPQPPHEAKNIVAVGATHSGRGIHYPQESDVDEVAPFSAYGPTVDSRIFPTLVAPGAWLISARAPIPGKAPACLGPAEALALYCSKSGTSMAAPHVSGAAALIHEWWQREQDSRTPSPALVKALLVNSATDVGDPDIPNNIEGWGRVSLGRLFSNSFLQLVDQRIALQEVGTEKNYEVAVSAGGSLKISLVWADAPAVVGASPTLVNDLDLIVERIEEGKVVDVWRGNNFANGWSFLRGEPDRLNNIENVFLAHAPAGLYRVNIVASNLPGDGIPGNRDTTDQDFALVVSKQDQ